MAEEIEIIVTATGFDKVSTGLKNTNEALKTTANEATKTGNALKSSLNAGSNQAGQSLQNLSRIAQDAPFGFIGIANNINPLVESFGRLKAETGSTGGALKALVSGLSGPAGIGLAFGVVTAAISFAQIGFDRWNATAKKTKDAVDETQKAISEIVKGLASEATSVVSLTAILNNETESRSRKLSALKELKAINPQIFGDLELEKNKVNGLSQAYNVYIESLKSSITAKLLQGRIEKELTKLIELQGGALTQSEKGILNIGTAINSGVINNLKQFGSEGANAAINLQEVNNAVNKNTQNNIDKVKGKITDLTAELSKLSGSIKLPPIVSKEQITKIEKTKEAVKTFNDVITATVKNIADQKDLAIILDESTVKEQIKVIRSAIESGVKDFNLPGNDQRILVLTALLPDLEAEAALLDASNKIQKKAKEKKGILTIKVPVIINPDVEVSKILKDALSSAMTSIGVGLGEGLANAINGTANFGDIFTSIFQGLGGVINQLGSQLIEIGVLGLLAKTALAQIFINPLASIAVGIALVTLGSLIQSATTPKNRFAVGTRNAPKNLNFNLLILSY